MNRLDRALGILLLLRSGETWSAADLAQRFEVSMRTIYRDIDSLSELGVPVYAEMGRTGGFRLMEGYFLPPVMFSIQEAVPLMLGLTLLRSLRARPFERASETVEHKLLAALPDHVRAILAQSQRLIGFETVPEDAFHQAIGAPSRPSAADEGQIVSVFLQAILDRRTVAFKYRSAYGKESENRAIPLGIFWDQDYWYLVGQRLGRREEARTWRADRVLKIRSAETLSVEMPEFDVRNLLGRGWLRRAMQQWSEEAPVVLRITQARARLLQRDWYYQHASFDDLPDGSVRLTFGQDNREVVFELVRWLGPGTELIAPEAWRAAFSAELRQMLDCYTD